MKFKGHGWSALALLFLVGAAGAAPPQDTTHAGELVYQHHCAQCHDHGEALRAPTLATLKGMRYQQVYYALTVGKMQAQGRALSPTDRSELIDYLIGRARVSDAWTAQLRCTAQRRTVDLSMPATVADFGFDLHNHRHLTAQEAGISTGDFRHMELAWALAFPRATTMRAQAAVVGSTLFLPVADASQLYAIDIAARPCLKWIYKSDVPLRTGVGYGALPGSHRKVLVFADVGTRIHMVDAATGAPIWKHAVHLTSLSNTTGTPVLLLAHPRLVAKCAEHGIKLERPDGSLHVREPLAYPEMVAAVLGSAGVVTDSGGLQKEAFLLGRVCTTLRTETEWVETLEGGWNVLTSDVSKLPELAARPAPTGDRPMPYGDGHAAERVVSTLAE